MRFQRRGGRKRIVAPDGSDIAPISKLQPDGTLVKALARAWRWRRQIRLGRPLPRSDEAIDQDETREGFVRSLVEAFRLTAADLLAVDLRELRATWLMIGSTPDVVLHDGVTRRCRLRASDR